MPAVLNPNEAEEVRVDTAKVIGKADLINGVFGSSRIQTGVIGQSDNYVGVSGDGKFIGVSGTSRSGTGVSGESNSAQGVGVYGKGGRLAGLFEGKVQVTGGLTVGSVTIASLVDRIGQLEDGLQQAANSGDVDARLRVLENTVRELAKEIASLAATSHFHTT